MNAVVAYLCSDGEVHVFDAADRSTPLCQVDALIIGQSDARTQAMACETCCAAVLDEIEKI